MRKSAKKNDEMRRLIASTGAVSTSLKIPGCPKLDRSGVLRANLFCLQTDPHFRQFLLPGRRDRGHADRDAAEFVRTENDTLSFSIPTHLRVLASAIRPMAGGQ